MRLCSRCRKAENPQGDLQFVDSPEGILCKTCYDRLYSVDQALSAKAKAEPGEALVVIVCPTCRGRPHALHGERCESCCGYGSVRIPANALPVYRPPKKQLLTEEHKEQT